MRYRCCCHDGGAAAVDASIVERLVSCDERVAAADAFPMCEVNEMLLV